ncbi:MAG TPA: MarR family transcriptional regulator [Rhizobiales bacterium]|nr:marR family protein [bacterium BMS3Bbin10]HDO52572.1 MarR family transcriptional regulator [Hyphomicrobiales bacterium]
MTDINEQVRRPGAKTASIADAMDDDARNQPEADPALLDLVELLFFAYRDFTREPDKILEEIGFGRAHHRVLHFVNRHSGLRVADLLDILKITKQSLGRVLKQLVDEGYIVQEAGKTDRRERLLYTTARGQELADRLALPQLRRIAHALDASGAESQSCIGKFLSEMVCEADRAQVSQLLKAGAGARGRSGEPA